jgi:two-component system chemotaxis response regulator CheB
MPVKDIIVIGASAGGIEALKALVRGLPKDFKASVFIVLHTAPYSLGILPEILARAGSPLPAANAKDWEGIERGRIYVAPPDYHLLIERSGYTRITKGPRENRFRPAVDPLFRSAALAYGPRVVGVVLTGWLDDGTDGLRAVKERGGTAVVQNPEDAFAPSMPLNALKQVEVNYCVPLEEIAPLLVRLTEIPAEEEGEYPVSEKLETEVKIAREDNALESGIMRWGEPSIYACPECHGVLLQLKEGGNVRFRCHTGHAYSVDSLLAEFTEKTEESLWSTIRSIEETAILLRNLAGHFRQHLDEVRAETLTRKAEEALERADTVRRAAMRHEILSDGKLGRAAEEA